MDGFYIKTSPMTPEIASEIDRLLQTIQISGSSAEAFLTIRGSLARIIDSTDVVSQIDKEDK